MGAIQPCTLPFILSLQAFHLAGCYDLLPPSPPMPCFGGSSNASPKPKSGSMREGDKEKPSYASGSPCVGFPLVGLVR